MKRYQKVKTPFKKAYEILSRGIVTEWELRMLRKNIRNRWDPENWSLDDRYNLISLFERDCVCLDLSIEQQRKGIEWLRKTHFKKNGAQRKSSKVSSSHLFIIRNFSHFTFQGVRPETLANGQIEAHCVYRTHAKNGMYFDYTINPSFFGAEIEYDAVDGGSLENELKLIQCGAK